MATGVFLHMAYTRYFALMLALATATTVIAPMEALERNALVMDEIPSQGQAGLLMGSGLQEGRS